jgi:hypothetical protein
MIADRNMLDLEAVLLVVRRKVRPEVDVELQKLVGEQADDRAGTPVPRALASAIQSSTTRFGRGRSPPGE